VGAQEISALNGITRALMLFISQAARQAAVATGTSRRKSDKKGF